MATACFAGMNLWFLPIVRCSFMARLHQERTFDVETLYNENPSYKASLHYNNIIGIGCSLWCDYGLTENMLDERLFPRVFVLAQQMWGSSSPSFSEFGENIKSIMNFFSVAGYSKKSNDAQ